MDLRRAHLNQLLSSHRPKDAREAAHLRDMQQLAARSLDPFDRASHEPGHFTASAFVLSPDRRALLLILHGKLGRWLQPGGHIDPGDPDVERASRREVFEETGLDALQRLVVGPLDLDVHHIPARAQEPAHAHFDLRFAFVASHREARAASDARGVRWVPLEEVQRVETDESVMRAVRALRHHASEHG